MRGVSIIVVLMLMSFFPRPVAAENATLAEALTRYQAGELDTALSRLAQALGEPGNRPADLEEIHCQLGILHAVLGQDEDARRSFEICLSLNPQRPVPPELGPEQRLLFDRARAARGGARLEIRVQELGATASRQGVRLRIRTANAPTDVVTRILVRAGDQNGAVVAELPVDVAGEIRAVVPCESICPVFVEAHDATGGVLAVESATATLPPLVVENIEPNPAVDPPPESRSILRSPWFWIVTGALIAGGVTAGVMLTRPDADVVILAPVVE